MSKSLDNINEQAIEDVINKLQNFEETVVKKEESDIEPEELNEEQTKSEEQENLVLFSDLGLDEDVLRAIKDLGFETPSPIQERSIGPLLDGHDILGQAQTGTGKTAAFGLPLLSRVDRKATHTQILILAPTRELAIQVAEACQSFAKYIPHFNVLPIYGGASYEVQVKALNKGAQVVVGTPGRVMDMIKRGKLKLDKLSSLVLDEADEMLRMGFIEDVEWIIEQCPEDRQIALFSATMPDVIKRVAKQYLNSPIEVKIASKTTTATTVRQRYWLVSGLHKIDALTRLLEVEPYDALIIFTRTKTEAEELTNRLLARGHSCEALHGDIPQKIREKTIERLKNGQLDVLVATDVAARGLDVDRITHVVNYDIPYDPESYVHRIGRTGRAGRTGDAILFVSPKDRRMLRLIEHTTKQPIEPMKMPTNQDINKHRVMEFKKKLLASLADDDLGQYQELIAEILAEGTVDAVDLCAALAKMVKGGEPLFIDESQPEPKQSSIEELGGSRRDKAKKVPSSEPVPLKDFPDIKMERYRVAVGYKDGVKPGQIVGAIANEGDIESQYIGNIDIYETFATVDLPEGMPADTMDILKKARVCGRALEIRKYYADRPSFGGREGRRNRERFDDNSSKERRNHPVRREGERSNSKKSNASHDNGSQKRSRNKKNSLGRGVPFNF